MMERRRRPRRRWLEFATGEISYLNSPWDVLIKQMVHDIDVDRKNTIFPGVKNPQIRPILIHMLLVLSAKGKGI